MTYSIVARDAATGDLGVAVQSHYFSVGSVVPWAEAGVGAVATQATASPDYGPRGVALMRDGVGAPRALASLVEADPGRDVRQVAMVDAQGNAAAHTGQRCIEAAGHVIGAGFSVQANMMVDAAVWPAMRDAFLAAQGDLADRLLGALDAAQRAGGDIRGQQSAAMLIVRGERMEKPWRGVLFDLNVEDHPRPLEELRRLVRVKRAYTLADAGDDAMSERRIDEAAALYRRAVDTAPEVDELQFWAGISLFREGRAAEAAKLLRSSFAANPALADLVPRLVHLGIVRAEDIAAIVAHREGR